VEAVKTQQAQLKEQASVISDLLERVRALESARDPKAALP
jgi:hypothetical protein